MAQRIARVAVVVLLVRLLLVMATAHSFACRGAAYWPAPLADPAAVLRVIATTIRPPREWRGQLRTEVPGG